MLPPPSHAADSSGRTRLHSLWALQLQREYDFVLYERRLKMPAPLLRVAPLQGRWAAWDAARGEIVVGVELIQEHSWDVVLEVLKHEMAHQWVSLYGPARALPHGPDFAHACQRLGVAAWAVRASGALPQDLTSWRTSAVPEVEQRLLRRVEKLLSLATSSNEHEALSAMQRVREIYSRYNLQRAAAGMDGEMVHQLIHTGRRRLGRLEGAIVGLLVAHFSVRAVFCSLFDKTALCGLRTIELLGLRENVAMADYVYHFLHQQVASLWQAKRQQLAAGRAAKNSYMLGVIRGFRAKLEASEPAPPSGLSPARSAALMVLSDRALAAFETQRHPRLSNASWGRRQHDAGSFAAGMADGDSLTLSRPIAGSGRQRQRLLEA